MASATTTSATLQLPRQTATVSALSFPSFVKTSLRRPEGRHGRQAQGAMSEMHGGVCELWDRHAGFVCDGEHGAVQRRTVAPAAAPDGDSDVAMAGAAIVAGVVDTAAIARSPSALPWCTTTLCVDAAFSSRTASVCDSVTCAAAAAIDAAAGHSGTHSFGAASCRHSGRVARGTGGTDTTER